MANRAAWENWTPPPGIPPMGSPQQKAYWESQMTPEAKAKVEKDMAAEKGKVWARLVLVVLGIAGLIALIAWAL